MLEVPTWDTYYPRNGGRNSLVFSVCGIDFYFSYSTLVAFRGPVHGLTIHQNIWSRTTGAHLNAINPDHSIRVMTPIFECNLRDEIAFTEMGQNELSR